MTNLFSIIDRGLWTESSEKKYSELKWKEKEKGEKGIIRPRNKEGCVDTMAPNGCESSGAKHNRAGMFLTWYQVNARHPRAESL